MKKKTLYVTDLDGTLLGGDSRISNASAEMLTRLADAGVMFTAATARTPATVQPLMRKQATRWRKWKQRRKPYTT